MVSIVTELRKLTITKKACLLGIISFFSFVLFFGFNVVYAYYYNSTPLSILASSIGDFDTGNGDSNILIYRETGKGTNVYTRTYAVPALGYKFNEQLTVCSRPCEDNPNNKCNVTCGTDSTSSCYYNYDDSTKSFSLTSNHVLSCKFYFNSQAESDINVYIMLENEDGTDSYNSKSYIVNENIPAYGYKYAGYKCDTAVESFAYEAETKKFVISTANNNTCYAYFDIDDTSNTVVNVFVQSREDSAVYEQVDTIPANNTYELSTSQISKCYNSDGDVESSISYTDGYVDVVTTGNPTCDVYLDLTTN